MVSGKLSFNYDELLVLQIPHIEVNDTKWHHVEILWTYNSLTIAVDYIYQISVPSSYGADLGEVEQFFFGARKNSTTSTVYDGFRGCLQGAYMHVYSGMSHAVFTIFSMKLYIFSLIKNRTCLLLLLLLLLLFHYKRCSHQASHRAKHH